ncbi:MAG: TolC family protein [Desulfobacterales bacterium]|nr:TolC family protein [Desulfobacterales bacterium]
MTRIRLQLLVFILSVSVYLFAWITPNVYAARDVTIAIIKDGPSFFLDQRIKGVVRELKSLASPSFNLRFKGIAGFNAQWQPDQIRLALLRALSDPSVDLVYAAGILVSEAAADSALMLNKPVVAGVGPESELAGLKGNDAGHSPKANLSFISFPNTVEEDIDSFQRLVGFSTLQVLMDRRIFSASKHVAAYIARIEREKNIQVTVVPVDDLAEPVLAALSNADAVLLTLFPRLSPEETQTLIDGINRLKIPSFSILGRPMVEKGVMAGRLPPVENRIQRRTALNMHQILLGEPVGHLTVNMALPMHLFLNIETANTIGFEANIATLVDQVEWVGEQKAISQTALSLEEAMRMAATENPEVAIAADQVAGADAVHKLAKSGLFPHIYNSVQYRQIDSDRAASALGNAPEQLTTLGAGLQQMIYSDDIITGFKAAGLRREATTWNFESVKLDQSEAAGKRFLQCLSAMALLRIETDNLAVTQKHLRLAQVRRQVGTAGPEELFRWEAEAAMRQSAVISARQTVEIAFEALNQSMGKDQALRWQPQDIDIGEDQSYFLGNRFHRVVKNMAGITQLAQFSTQTALENAPELAQIEKERLALNLELAQQQRRYFVPTVSAAAGYTYNLDKSGKGANFDIGFELPGLPSQDDHEWSLSLNLTLPLYEGGAKSADIQRAGAMLNRIHHIRQRTCRLLEQRARTAVFNLSQSWPNIFLNRKAAGQAAKNLERVQHLYAQGKLGITDLISAQNHHLLLEQASALAVYRYLTDLVAYQRAIAWFEFEKSGPEKEALLNRLSAFMSKNASSPEPFTEVRQGDLK